MKLFFVFTIATALVLIAKSSTLFGNTKNCKFTACCAVTKKCSDARKEKIETAEIDINPFTILIPGNHF